jgi:hypothetical protein
VLSGDFKALRPGGSFQHVETGRPEDACRSGPYRRLVVYNQ